MFTPPTYYKKKEERTSHSFLEGIPVKTLTYQGGHLHTSSLVCSLSETQSVLNIRREPENAFSVSQFWTMPTIQQEQQQGQ